MIGCHSMPTRPVVAADGQRMLITLQRSFPSHMQACRISLHGLLTLQVVVQCQLANLLKEIFVSDCHLGTELGVPRISNRNAQSICQLRCPAGAQRLIVIVIHPPLFAPKLQPCVSLLAQLLFIAGNTDPGAWNRVGKMQVNVTATASFECNGSKGSAIQSQVISCQVQ